MIESMVELIKANIPLRIKEITWDKITLDMYGPDWNWSEDYRCPIWAFASMCAWRLSDANKVILGCSDKSAKKKIQAIRGLDITDIEFQEEKLKVDPVFILSNSQKLEIFSTDNFEPWTFRLYKEFFAGNPGCPELFDPNYQKENSNENSH